jgi:2-keto-4-pentenoate hydratase
VPAGTVGRIGEVERVLRASDERLEAGDRVITGAVVQTSVSPGDGVVAAIEGLGRVELTIA